MVAKQAFRFRPLKRRMAQGETFEAKDRDARLLIAARLAEFAKVQPAKEVKSRGRPPKVEKVVEPLSATVATVFGDTTPPSPVLASTTTDDELTSRFYKRRDLEVE
jgi:hypothetical protein